MQYQLDLRPAHQRLQQSVLEIARQRGDGADPQRLSAGGAASLQKPDQLVAGAEDRVSVVERDATRLGQHEALAAALEQFLPHALLELPQLYRQRRLRDMQSLGGARQIALVCDGPEVAQVVVVQCWHENVL